MIENKRRYHVAKRTAIDGKTWWTCYYKDWRHPDELTSRGRFKLKRIAEFFKQLWEKEGI